MESTSNEGKGVHLHTLVDRERKRSVKTYDFINRVVLTLPLSVYEGTWTHSTLSLLCITMILRVRKNFFEITTFPTLAP